MAKFMVGGPSGLAVTGRFKRDSDGYYWNNSTEAWQIATADVSMPWDADMEYYAVSITHADFISEAMTVRYVSGGSITLAHGAYEKGGVTVITAETSYTKQETSYN